MANTETQIKDTSEENLDELWMKACDSIKANSIKAQLVIIKFEVARLQ